MLLVMYVVLFKSFYYITKILSYNSPIVIFSHLEKKRSFYSYTRNTCAKCFKMLQMLQNVKIFTEIKIIFSNKLIDNVESSLKTLYFRACSDEPRFIGFVAVDFTFLCAKQIPVTWRNQDF